MPADTLVLVERADGVGVLTMNRAHRRNALSRGLLEALAGGLDGLEADRAVRCLLLRAAGDHFSAGADLDEVDAARATAAGLGAHERYGHRLFRRFEASRLPVVVAVQGYCLAGGLELMLSADVAIAAEGARIGDQHARFGLAPGWGSTQRLPRTVGMRRALDLMFSGRHLTGAEAEVIGLVNRAVPDDRLADEAMAYCRTIAAGNPDGLAFMKRMARRGAAMSLDDGLAMEEASAVRELMADNIGEGIAAFRERRTPTFE